MRLPTLGNRSEIDESTATDMLHYAIDRGVNYVDTAWFYHGGNSERFVGKALKGPYRQKVKIATKLPVRIVETAKDFDRYLNEQLEKLQTEHVEFYLLHGLRKESWRRVKSLDVLEWAEGAVRDGRIGHLGFSIHDDFDGFKEIIDGYDRWDLCLIQHNYMNESTQAGTRGLKYAAERGLAVAIMEPLLGGGLANQPGSILEIWREAGHPRTPADWAFQWLWNKPQVSVVLSGMSAMEQVRQNIESAERSGIGTLTDEELRLVERVRDRYAEIRPIPCTQCGYCMPCPHAVDIPMNLDLYNTGVMFEQLESSKMRYRIRLSNRASAEVCVHCLECEDKCPQSIPISEWMSRIAEEFSETSGS
jgi:predicted aldo/keto reductase-like oxidoreductase